MSRLAHFPEFMAGELLYGVLARHRRHGGMMPAAVHALDLFGRSAAIATFDLPCGLGELASRLPQALNLEVGELLNHTLFPYYAAFQPSPVRDRAMAELITGASSSAHNRLGVNAFAIRPLDALRFCPGCLRDQIEALGEPTWMAVHQAPGVEVCPQHHCIIETSGVTRTSAGRHGYLVPDAATRAQSMTPMPVGLAGERLIELATRLASLWTVASPAVDLVHRRDDYRARLDAVGLMRSPEKADVVGLVTAFRDHWGPALPYLSPACSIPDEGGWLAAIVRTHRKSFHPILHVMLRSLVELSPAAPRPPLPFGSGPWPCRNPLADHHGQPVQMKVTLHREKYGQVAMFACACGYEFTRSIRAGGSVGDPRMRSPGPLLRAALERLVVPGAKLRAVAREVGLDPKTVVREAMAAGIEVPWTTKPSGRPVPRRKEAVRADVVRRPHPGRPRLDWPAIDRDLVEALKTALREVVSLVPPVRAGRAELERRVARTGYFAKRKTKLPVSSALLNQLAEDVETFQRRRVRHLMTSLGGEARPWWIARAAGLKSGMLDLVEDEMRRVQGSEAVASGD